jgi:hypothetical protein
MTLQTVSNYLYRPIEYITVGQTGLHWAIDYPPLFCHSHSHSNTNNTRYRYRYRYKKSYGNSSSNSNRNMNRYSISIGSIISISILNKIIIIKNKSQPQNKIFVIKNKSQPQPDAPHQKQATSTTRCSSSRTRHSVIKMCLLKHKSQPQQVSSTCH